MDDLTLLTGAEHELNRVIATLEGGELDVVSNCPPWTVRRWPAMLSRTSSSGPGSSPARTSWRRTRRWPLVPYEGELAPIAAEVTDRVARLWHTEGVLAAHHDTPFGELPGAVVVNFAIVDAAAHAWDLSASLGRAIEFPSDWIPRMTGVVELTCTEHAVEIGLVKPPTEPPDGATDTHRLMAAAGRTVAGPRVVPTNPTVTRRGCRV